MTATMRKRQYVSCPHSVPLLHVLYNLAGGIHVLRFSDSMSPDAARKAKDASGMELYIALGETELPPDEARFHRTITRNPIDVQFQEHDDGKVATYYGRWVSRRGDTGPWSLPMSFRVAV